MAEKVEENRVENDGRGGRRRGWLDAREEEKSVLITSGLGRVESKTSVEGNSNVEDAALKMGYRLEVALYLVRYGTVELNLGACR